MYADEFLRRSPVCAARTQAAGRRSLAAMVISGLVTAAARTGERAWHVLDVRNSSVCADPAKSYSGNYGMGNQNRPLGGFRTRQGTQAPHPEPASPTGSGIQAVNVAAWWNAWDYYPIVWGRRRKQPRKPLHSEASA